MMQQQQSGGMMGGLGGMVAQGMAIGTGSAIAHTAVDGVMSSMGMGRHSNSAPAAAPVQQEAPDACSNQNKAFQDVRTRPPPNPSLLYLPSHRPHHPTGSSGLWERRIAARRETVALATRVS